MRATEWHVRIKIVVKIFNVRESTSNDDSSHGVSNKADSCWRAKINSFEKVIKLNGKSFSKRLNMLICSSLIGRADKNSAVVPNFEAVFKKYKILSWSLISMNKDNDMFIFFVFRLLNRNYFLHWHDRCFQRHIFFRRWWNLSECSFGKIFNMNTWVHGNSGWKSSLLFLTEIIFIDSIIFKLVRT